MFQGSEIFVILLVALIVLGPERLPVVARKLGSYTAELRKAARELRVGLESELGDVSGIVEDIRSPINEVKKVARDTAGEMKQISSDTTKDLDQAKREIGSPSSWVGPKPISGPTPEDAMADLEAIQRTGKPLDATDLVGRETAGEIKQVSSDTTKDLDQAKREIGSASSWVGPRPISGPTPEDAMADLEAIQRTGKPLDGTDLVTEGEQTPGEATG